MASTSDASVLLITGPAGVGKTTVAWAVSNALEARGVAHAKVDTDELDRVVPQPPLPELVQITERNLRAVWSTFAELGHTRLVLAGVMLDLPAHLAWYGRMLDTGDVRAVRLVCDDDALRTRVVGREQDAHGAAEQLERSLAYNAFVREETLPDGVLVLDTTNRTSGQVAEAIVGFSGWASA